MADATLNSALAALGLEPVEDDTSASTTPIVQEPKEATTPKVPEGTEWVDELLAKMSPAEDVGDAVAAEDAEPKPRFKLMGPPEFEAPPPPQPILFGTDTIAGIWHALKGLGRTGTAAFYQLTEGLDDPRNYSESARKAFEEADQYAQEMQRTSAAKKEAGTSTWWGDAFRQAAPSTGFSGVAMGVQIPSQIAGGMAGKVLGGMVGGPVGAGVGGFVVGKGTGIAAGYAAAYRMAGAMFINEAFNQAKAQKGRDLTEEEMDDLYEKVLPIAQNTAAWEAGPEAVGNAISIAGLGKIFGFGKKGAKKVGEKVIDEAVERAASGGIIKKVGSKVGAAAMTLGGELTTETITQVGQSADQQKLEAILQDESPEGISPDWSPENVAESFKEVFPATLALMTMMGGGAAGLKVGAMGVDKLTQRPKDLAAEAKIAAAAASPIAPETAKVVENQADAISVNATVGPLAQQPNETDAQYRARLEAEAAKAATVPLEEQPTTESVDTGSKSVVEPTPAARADFRLWLNDQSDAAKLRQLREDNIEEGNQWAADMVDERLVELGKLTRSTQSGSTPTTQVATQVETTGQGAIDSTEAATTKPLADEPSPTTPPRATESVEPRPIRKEGETAREYRARYDVWDESYGGMRKGGRTHNDDGTPYQPTVFDDVNAAINRNKIRQDGDKMARALGTRSELDSGMAVKDLLNAGWVWSEQEQRMVNPANPQQTAAQGLADVRAKIKRGESTLPATTNSGRRAGYTYSSKYREYKAKTVVKVVDKTGTVTPQEYRVIGYVDRPGVGRFLRLQLILDGEPVQQFLNLIEKDGKFRASSSLDSKAPVEQGSEDHIDQLIRVYPEKKPDRKDFTDDAAFKDARNAYNKRMYQWAEEQAALGKDKEDFAATTTVTPEEAALAPATAEVVSSLETQSLPASKNVESSESLPTEPVAPRPKVAFADLPTAGRRASKVLTAAGVDEDTANYVASEYAAEMEGMNTEEQRSFILDKFEEGGGVIPGTTRFNENQEYYEMAFGVSPQEAAVMVENAKIANAASAQNELSTNQQWRKRSEQPTTTQTQGQQRTTQPDGARAGAIPTGEGALRPTLEGGRVPESAAAPVARIDDKPAEQPRPSLSALPLFPKRDDTATAGETEGDLLEDFSFRRPKAAEPQKEEVKKASEFETVGDFRKAFNSRGVGHARFAIRLDLMQEDGGITEDGKSLILATIWDNNTNDEFLKNIEMGSARRNVKSYGYGGRSPQMVKGGVVGQKPLLEMLRVPPRGIDSADKKTALTLNTFWHEFGHAGYFSLLTGDQKKIVDAEFKKTTRQGRIAFFAEGKSDAENTAYFSKYYSKNQSEWFAQSFAEYVLTQKSDQKKLVPLFEQLLNKIKSVFGALFARKEQVGLNDIFDYILRGEAYGKKPTWQMRSMSTTPSVYGTPRYQAIAPDFTKRMLEREGATPSDIADEVGKAKKDIKISWKNIGENEYGNNSYIAEVRGKNADGDDVVFKFEMERFEYAEGKSFLISVTTINPDNTADYNDLSAKTMKGATGVAQDFVYRSLNKGDGDVRPTPQSPATETRQSRISPPPEQQALDTRHAELERRAKAGDKEAEAEAQRMVDEAAKAAGYSVTGWHASTKDFDEFAPAKVKRPFLGRFHFALDRKLAEEKYAETWNLEKGDWDKGKTKKFALKYSNPATEAQYMALLEKSESAERTNEELMAQGYDAVLSQDDYMPLSEQENKTVAVFSSSQIKSADPFTYDNAGNLIPLSERFNPETADIRQSKATTTQGMETNAVEGHISEAWGIQKGGIVRVVSEPNAEWDGRTLIRDGKVIGIELNAAALPDTAAVDRVLNHEMAEAANADGALNDLVSNLTEAERTAIEDTITRLGYSEKARTPELAARGIEQLAKAWQGRGFFIKAVARVEAWAAGLGLKLTRRAAEYIAAKNLGEVSASFKATYANAFAKPKSYEDILRQNRERLDAEIKALPKPAWGITDAQKRASLESIARGWVERFASGLRDSGISIEYDPAGSVSNPFARGTSFATVKPDGRIQIVIGTSPIEAGFENNLGEQDAGRAVALDIEEEVIHGIYLKRLLQSWDGVGDPRTFVEEVLSRRVDSIKAAVGDGLLRTLAEDALTSYYKLSKSTEDVSRMVDDLLAGNGNSFVFMNELARMVVQKRVRGITTEEQYFSLIEQANQWISEMLDTVRGFLANPSMLGADVAMELNAVADEYQALLDASIQTRESLAGTQAVTPQMDADYLAAVERGDMETAQRMVDEAAKGAISAMPRIEAGDTVDGLVVRDAIPNQESIRASVENPDYLGLRAFPMSWLSGKAGKERQLADAIEASGEINPLIVVVSGHEDGPAYVLEGAHRIDALFTLGKQSFPAQVVFDDSETAVVRDNQGNVIPLSQRFNPESVDIRQSRREQGEDVGQTVTATAEQETVRTLGNSFGQADALSDRIGGKPATQKVADIATKWMEDGGTEAELKAAILEGTNLSEANADILVGAIAKQYEIQQRLAEYRASQPELAAESIPEPEAVQTPDGRESVPEGQERPKKTAIQRAIELVTGVRKPTVKLTVNEKTALKDQIRAKARTMREAKKSQQALAAEMVEVIKGLGLEGSVKPRQVEALLKRAVKVNFASEKSVETFVRYAEKVVENANYDRDVSEARLAQKRAKAISKKPALAKAPQREVLDAISKVDVRLLNEPASFTAAINHYLRGFKSPVAKDYEVVPDKEMLAYLAAAQDEATAARNGIESATRERLAEKHGVTVDELDAIFESEQAQKEIDRSQKKDALDAAITEAATDSLAALKNLDDATFTESQRAEVAAIKKINPAHLDRQTQVDLVRIVNNILINGTFHGAGRMIAAAEGQAGARDLARNKKLVANTQAWTNVLFKPFGKTVGKWQRDLATSLQSVSDTFRNIWGTKGMAAVRAAIGLDDFNRGKAIATRIVNEISEAYNGFYTGQRKKYGDKVIRSQEGLAAEGVAAFLTQKYPNMTEQESIAIRRSVVLENIANLVASSDSLKIEEAKMVEGALNTLAGDTVAEIEANLKASHKHNYESLVWLRDTLLPKYRDQLRDFDQSFNDQASNYENPLYLPIKYRFQAAIELDPDASNTFYDVDSLTPKQAANSIKRMDYNTLPQRDGRQAEIDFNLRKNVFGSLSDQIYKANTSKAWAKMGAFLKTPEAELIAGNRANFDFLNERLTGLKSSNERRFYQFDGAARLFDAVATFSRKVGIGLALGGYGQALKQAPDQIATTILNTGEHQLQAENLATIMGNRDEVMPLLSQFSIGNRGDAAAGGTQFGNEFESGMTRAEQFWRDGNVQKLKEFFTKAGDVWLTMLKKSDFIAAASGWMTYYQHDLKKKGIQFTDWKKEAELVKTDPARKEAAQYAESMIDIYQGSSDPTMMATFAQRGKGGYENIFKAIFLPFNSFVTQQRMRMYSDARDMVSNSIDMEQRSKAARGLAGTMAGIVVFHSIRRYLLPAISGVGIYALYAALGVDPEEPDEEKKQKEAEFKWKQFKSEVVTNIFVGGFGRVTEEAFIDSWNYLAYLGDRQLDPDSVTDKDGKMMSYNAWAREKSPLWRYREFGTGAPLGMLDIAPAQVGKAVKQMAMTFDPDVMEDLSDEEKRLIYVNTVSQLLYTMRLNDTDIARMTDRAQKELLRAAKEREKEAAAIRRRVQ